MYKLQNIRVSKKKCDGTYIQTNRHTYRQSDSLRSSAPKKISLKECQPPWVHGPGTLQVQGCHLAPGNKPYQSNIFCFIFRSPFFLFRQKTCKLNFVFENSKTKKSGKTFFFLYRPGSGSMRFLEQHHQCLQQCLQLPPALETESLQSI